MRQLVRTKRIKNEDLYQLCKTIPWSVTIKQKRLKWFGHFNRLPKEAPARKAFNEAYLTPVRKIRGGQPLQWLHTVKRDFKSINITIEEAIKLAEDRQGYQDIVNRVMVESLHQEVSSEDSSTEE